MLVVQPTDIQSVDENNINIFFDLPFSGKAVVGYGNQVSGSTAHQFFGDPEVSWSFNHGLGSRFINLQAFDEDFNQVIPDTLVLTSKNSALATFTSASTGYLIATRGGNPFSGVQQTISQGNFIFDQPNASSTWTFDHNAGSKYPIVTVYDNQDEVVIPNTITAIDENTISIGFDQPVAGTAVVGYGLQVSGSTSFTEFSVPAVSWSFDHNLGSRFVNVQVFDDNFRQIIPDTLELTSDSSSLATFATASTGYMVATIGGEPVVGSVSSSYAGFAESSSFADFSTSSSFADFSTSSSFALTASYAENAGAGSGFPFSGSAVITGSLLVSGSTVDFTDATQILGLSGRNQVFEQPTPALTWSFVHGQNAERPVITVYDFSSSVIIPQTLTSIDADTVEATFAVPQSGYLTVGFGDLVSGSTTYEQFSTSNTWSFDHNLGTRFITVQAYDINYNQIIPTNIQLISTSSAELTFGSASAGFAVATVGGDARGSLEALPNSPGVGTFVLQSVDDIKSYTKSVTLDSITFNSGSQYNIQLNTDVDSGTEIIATVDTGSYKSAFFDYLINDGTNYRAGTVTSVWDGTSVEFNEVSTNDIGNTSDVTMSVDLGNGQARLKATTTTNNWNIRSIVRTL
jgi:hypothetical protein